MAITIGLRTNTHVFICAEKTLANSIIKVKDTEDRIFQIKDTLVSISGEQEDEFRLASYCQEYCNILSLKTKTEVSPKLAANVIQNRVYSSLRSKPVHCYALVGGKGSSGMELMCIDPYGALFQDNFVATGYGLYFLYGIYDAYYKKDMTEQEGSELIRLCLKTLKERMIIEADKWKLVVMDQENVRTESIEI